MSLQTEAESIYFDLDRANRTALRLAHKLKGKSGETLAQELASDTRRSMERAAGLSALFA